MSAPKAAPKKQAVEKTTEPHRPSDHFDSAVPVEGITQPRLGPVGYLRFFWRQLTSMRTALVLLLLLALAAVPGSLVPQRSSDPNGVIAYKVQNPGSYDVLDKFGVFDTFTSPWFSAIYILLFISLVGCIIPRTKHHFDALRARPPKTPARLERLIGFSTATTDADVETAILRARQVLRRQGYRVERYGNSLSAERGYLRETGNLVFHTALVGILLTVAVGGSFGYTGQKVVVQGTSFTNALLSYDSFNPGRFFSQSELEPFSIRLDQFDASYKFDPASGVSHPTDFLATLSTRAPGGDWVSQPLKVNSPLEIGGTQVYLLGNGYAPEITVRNPQGEAVYSGPVPYLPQDANLFSVGVIKIPNGLAEQIGMIGLFYPDPVTTASGALASFSPNSGPNSALSLTVYTGDLGLDAGTTVNAYSLNTDKLTEIAGRGVATKGLELKVGETTALPNGLGTVEFTGLKRFVSLDIHHDATIGWVLFFAISVLVGLLTSLFIPRRRVWVKASTGTGRTRLEYAGLARGEDPGLAAAVAEIARRHADSLEHRMAP